MNRVTEQLAIGYVFGHEDRTTIVLFAFYESRNFLTRNQILDFLLNDMGSSSIIIQNINIGHQKQLVALRCCIILPRFGHLLKVAHAVDFNENAFLGAEEVELTATILVALDKLHAQTLVLNNVPYVVFAQLLHINTISEAGTTLNHSLVDHPLERFILARQAYIIQELAPETAVNQVASGVFGATDIEVHVLPIVVGFAAEVFLVIVWVFVAQIVTA